MASILVEYTKIVDRWYGRWEKAVGAARVSNYAPERFTADVVESWVDWSYAAALPWAALGVLDVGVKPIFPVVRFVVTAKNDMTQVVPIQMPTGGAGVQAQQLDNPGGTRNIPAANVGVTRADGY